MRFDIAQLPDITSSLGPAGRALLERHLSEELVRLRADPLNNGHAPHEVQERLLASTATITLLVAANRLGKSEAGMREVLWRARGDHPYKNVKLHNVIWVGIKDFTFYRETTKVKFDEWCPKDWIVGSFHESEKWVKVKRIDGGTCTIQFKTWDQGRESWQGAGVDCIWLDEECPEDIYKEATARLIDTRGDMVLTYTPVGGMGWSFTRLYEPARDGRRTDITLIEGALAQFDEAKPYGVGRVLVPHLTREDILRFAREIPDEDERMVRIFGQYKKRSGLVYKQFHRHVHIVEPFQVPDHWEIWAAGDPGYHGFAVLFFAMAPSGHIFVIHEFFSQQQTTLARFHALGEFVVKLRGRNEADDVDRTPDPYLVAFPRRLNTDSSTQPVVVFMDTEDPQTVMELNIQAGQNRVPLAFASLDQGLKARKAGITRVQQMLDADPDRMPPAEVTRPTPVNGEPMLYFFENLYSEWRVDDTLERGSRILWEIQQYLWKKPPRGSSEPPDDADEHSAGGSHALASLRYGIMARMGAPPKPKMQSHREGVGQVDDFLQAALDEYEDDLMAGEYD